MIQLQPPPTDTLNGHLLTLPDGGQTVLVVGARSKKSLPGRLMHAGEIEVRYGLALLLDQDFVIPQFAMDDFRREYHAEEAIHFLLTRGDSYPRADVIGHRLSTNQREELFLKQIDLGQGLVAFAYAEGQPEQLLARIHIAVFLNVGVRDWSLAPPPSTLFGLAVRCYQLPPENIPRLAEYLRLTVTT